MARLAQPEDLPRPKGRGKQARKHDDLAVLSPDRTLTVGDRTITMREYRLLEGMRLHAVAEPLVAQLAALAEQAEKLPIEQLEAVIAQHPQAVVEMIALACDQPADWVANLPGAQGDAVFGAWWAVNSGFFVRRVQQRVLLHRAAAGRASSQPLSSADTTRNGSATTPSVN